MPSIMIRLDPSASRRTFCTIRACAGSSGASAGSGDFIVEWVPKEKQQRSSPVRRIGAPGLRDKPGARIKENVPPPEPAKPQAEAIPLQVVYEDDALVVIDK